MNSKKKIGFYVRGFPIPSQTFVLSQIEYVVSQGFDVTVFSKEKASYNKKSTLDIFCWPEEPSFTKRAFGFLKLLTKFDFLLFLIRTARYAPKRLIKLQCASEYMGLKGNKKLDILHVQFASYLPEVTYLQNIGSISWAALVVSCRGYDLTTRLKVDKTYYGKYYRKVNYFLPVSKSLAQHLIDADCPSDKIEILQSGINIREYPLRRRAPLSKEKAINLLTVGRLVRKKGIHISIPVVKILVENGFQVTYRIIGEGPECDNLAKLISCLDLTNVISLEGGKSHTEVIQDMLDSDIFLLHSLTAEDGDEEGIPNVLKEAMLVGLPVVSTRHGGISELVPLVSNNLLCSEGDIVEMCAIVKRIINMQNEDYHKLINECRGFAIENFDEQVVNQKLISIYNKCISGPCK